MKAKAKARSHLYLNKKMITLNTIKKKQVSYNSISMCVCIICFLYTGD